MNKSSKSTTDNPRFVCENWDRPEVVIEGHGKGRHPVRKVKTNGVIFLNEDVLMEKVANLLNRGYEVRIGSHKFDGAIRLIPVMDTSLTNMNVIAQSMGIFRTETLKGKSVKLIRKGEEVSRKDAEDYMFEKRNAPMNFESVTPDTVVKCPKCGYTFRVGARLSA